MKAPDYQRAKRPTPESIAQAKQCLALCDPHYESDDCILIAFEWLDAQFYTARPQRKRRALKHIIEGWAGRYVSEDDVIVAAYLHPEVAGDYPHYNLSTRLVHPSRRRLHGITSALTQSAQLHRDPAALEELL